MLKKIIVECELCGEQFEISPSSEETLCPKCRGEYTEK